MLKRCNDGCALALALLLLGGCAGVATGPGIAPEPEPAEAPAEQADAPVPDELSEPEPAPPGFPPEVIAGFNQALETMQGGAYAEAIPVLEALVQDYPDLPGLHVNLGIAWLHVGEDEKARISLLEALRLRPDDPVALNQLAVLQRRAGQFAAARELYEQALEAAPDYAGAHLNLGILCDLYLLQSSCALTHYARYVELSGESRQVQGWIADLERRVGKANVE